MVFKCVVVLAIFFANVLVSFAMGPTHNKVVVCYWGSWSVYRPGRGQFGIENIDPNLCTHLIYSFAGLKAEEDSIHALDPWQDLADNYGKNGYERLVSLKDRYPHLKVNLAIGGWNQGSVTYSQMVRDPARRTKFVTSAVNFIRKYRFDGLDLDWEFPGKRGGTPDDKLNFLLLVKELKAAFSKHNLLLTAAFGAGKDTIDIGYDVPGLSVYLDFIHMMCYDYHGTWDKKSGPNAPLRSNDALSVEYSINYMLKLGAPANKLVMGIPLYGRTFILEEPFSAKRRPMLGTPAKEMGFQGLFTRENGFMGYNEICMELKNTTSDWKTYWDDESHTPFAVSGDRLIAYDNVQSISDKVYFAMEKRLAGVMVWSIDTDDFYGDCSDDEKFVNFPLMNCIDKSIVQSLEDLKNAIVDDEKQGSASSQVSTSKLVMFTVLAVIFSLL